MDRETFVALVAAVEQESQIGRSRLHGPQHWRAVAQAGLQLCAAGTPADPLVVLLFGLLHDSQRWADGRDRGHGARAADYARAHLGGVCVTVQVEALCIACAQHDAGRVSADPTIGACWDADRLNLWRVGRRPDPRFLSTSAARQMIAWARGLHDRALSWEELWAIYAIVGRHLC